jgi:hypothetical protein
MRRGRVAAALGSGGVTPAVEKYVGAVSFRATSLGGGSMTVSLRLVDTQLRDSANQAMEVLYLGDITFPIQP